MQNSSPLVYFLLFFFFNQSFIIAQDFIITETYVVCAGESVFLPAAQEFPQPPIPPAGPDDPNAMPAIPCTPQLNQISILPTANSLAEGISGFTITPTVSAVYTVISKGLCGGPGTTEVGEKAVLYEVIVDTNCEAPTEPPATSQRETFTVCAGESVFLPAVQTFPQPPQPPAGPDDPNGIPVTPCTPQLNQISILPTANTVAEAIRGFTVTPTASAIYTVTSNGLCGGPGSAEFGELAVEYEVLVDNTCEVPVQELPSSAMDTFVVCAGASVFLPAAQEFPQPPLPPVGPDDPNGIPVTPCTPQLNQISILPTANTLAEGISGFTVTPTISGSYTVTSKGVCGGPASIQVGEIALTYHIIIDATCNSPEPPSNQLFSDFPWLTALTTTDCATASIVDYEKGGYHYLLVTDQNEQPILYFQDGSNYCQSTADYDCVTAYSLETVVNTWRCEDQTTSPSSNQKAAVFTEFPWLVSLVDPNSCTTESITQYENGSYHYLLVTDGNGQATLYFQDGSRYCQSTPNYDCIAAYGLSTEVSTWTCGGGTSLTVPIDYSIGSEPPVTKIFDYFACTGDVVDLLVPNFGNCPLDLPASTEVVEVLTLNQQFLTVRILDSGSFTFASVPNADCANVTHIYSFVIQPTCTVDPIFTNFPWLSTHINPTSCNGEAVSIYEVGGFQYVYVAAPDGNTLYFQNGDTYCTDAPNYDCRMAYNLESPTNTWSCNVSGLAPSTSTQRSFVTIAQDANRLKVFPNPVHHTFNVPVKELNNEIQQLQLIDMQGQIIQTIAIPAGNATRTISVDITDYAEGVYFVNLLSKGERTVQRIVKQRLD